MRVWYPVLPDCKEGNTHIRPTFSSGRLIGKVKNYSEQ